MVYASQYKPVTELFGFPEPPKTGRGRLVHTAVQLIYLHGFQAVGINQIIAAAGVTKSTFYKHFQSKDELLIEAMVPGCKCGWNVLRDGEGLVFVTGELSVRRINPVFSKRVDELEFMSSRS